MSDNLNRHFLSIEIVETDCNRAYWIDKLWALQTNRESLLSADLLVVPTESFRDEAEPTFPKGTESFVDHLQKILPDEVKLFVAIDHDKYQELALHADIWRIPTLFLSFIALPVLVNIFSNRLDEVLPGHKVEDTVELNLIVEGVSRKSIKMNFKGSAKEISKILSDSIPRYLTDLEKTHKPTKTPNKSRKTKCHE